MKSITKKVILSLTVLLVLTSCIIQNPKPKDCEVIEMKVRRISEGGVKDIVFHDTKSSNFYYINRGLEQDLNLDSLNKRVLNKTVNLQLSN